jgi:transposase/predicted site-specific integrase-resolvase
MSEQTTCRETYKEKLRPTPTQERQLEAVLWRCRALYNTALQQRITAWERCHVSVTRYQQEAELKAIREVVPEYAAIHSHVLQDMLARLGKTYQAFCRRVANGERPGFQGQNRYHSFTYKEYGNGARLENGYLVLAKLGRIAVRWSRPVEGAITTVTVSEEADGWEVCCSCAEVPVQPLALTRQETSKDVGLTVFLVTAEGANGENPRHSRTAERTLKKAQQRVSRRKKGSIRCKQVVKLCASEHQHVRRQRTDFHHKTALALVRPYDTLHIEAIQPADLSRHCAPIPGGNTGYLLNGAKAKAGLNTSIHDAGWGHFLNILAFTAACAGKRAEAVPPAYTTQECSGCGARVPRSLSTRTHVCPACGLILNRDENAARNIQWRGQRLRGVPALAGRMNREPAALKGVRSVRGDPPSTGFVAFYPALWHSIAVKLSDYVKQVGVTYKTAWQWWKAGQLDAYQLPTGTIIVREPHTVTSSAALYARVSSADQKNDAVRQMQRLRDYAAARGCPVVAEVIEIASGLNDERPKLKHLLTDQRVGVLVVEHRDRLTRFGYGYIATLLEQQGRRVEAIYSSDSGDGLVDDFIAVITSMAARIYGRRNSKRRAERIRACVEHVLQSEDARCG